MDTDIDKKWRDNAACIDQVDLFFSSDWRDWQKAKNLCAVCPVRRLCLKDSLEHEDRFGVWGGLDQYELRKTLSIDKNGDPVRLTTDPRCPYCKSKSLAIIEKKRNRINYECTDCEFQWWSRRAPVKREPKSDNVDPAVSARGRQRTEER